MVGSILDTLSSPYHHSSWQRNENINWLSRVERETSLGSLFNESTVQSINEVDEYILQTPKITLEGSYDIW